MRIRYGYRIELVCAHDMPLITLLDVHPSRRHDLTAPDEMKLTALADPSLAIAMTQDLDAFGNIRRRMIAPSGGIRLESQGVVHDSGEPDIINPAAREVSPSRLPDTALVYLLGSRYCETDKLYDQAWGLFGQVQPGWSRVQAIVDCPWDDPGDLGRLLRALLIASPSFSLRGGTREVIRGIIARGLGLR